MKHFGGPFPENELIISKKEINEIIPLSLFPTSENVVYFSTNYANFNEWES
jgi:hypothetical protein